MANSSKKCPHCSGGPHLGVCPSIKSIEYFENGTIRRVEYKCATDYPSIAPSYSTAASVKEKTTGGLSRLLADFPRDYKERLAKNVEDIEKAGNHKPFDINRALAIAKRDLFPCVEAYYDLHRKSK